MSKDWVWITKHFEELVTGYGGKYVAVSGGKVVAKGISRKSVEEMAKKKKPKASPFIMFVPRKENLECLI